MCEDRGTPEITVVEEGRRKAWKDDSFGINKNLVDKRLSLKETIEVKEEEDS